MIIFEGSTDHQTLLHFTQNQKSALHLKICIFITSIISNYKVEEDEVGGTCGTNGGEEERV
jgi:hypothetical protein